MGMENGLPRAKLLGWATRRLAESGDFTHVEYDDVLERVLFTVRSKTDVERTYKLTIERGRPVVQQIDGPA